MKNIEQVIEVFRENGYKITPQRIAIFEVLEGNTSHPSAEDIFKKLGKEHPTMSFTTVYNTLQTMRDLGQILELNIDRERHHYDPDISMHNHILCTKCGEIGDIFMDYSDKLDLPQEIASAYQISGHQVQFYGICSKCQSNN